MDNGPSEKTHKLGNGLTKRKDRVGVTKPVSILITILLLAVYCFAFQGRRGLFDPDEGRYSAVALQMIKSGDWVVPRTHPAQEHWAKPPLTYWAIAGSLLLFGHSEFAVRFPNALSFFLCVVIAYFLGRVFTPQRPWLTALVFGTFLFPATVCNGATTDYLMTMWQAAAVCCFARAYWGKKDSKRVLSVWLMWISFGLAFLTKGPPALLPLVSIMVFLRMTGWKRKDFTMSWVPGLLLMVLTGASWLIVMTAQKPGLLRYFVWDEFFLRVFTGHHARHAQWYSFIYIYFPVLILGALPWSYFTGRGMMGAVQKAGAKKDAFAQQGLFLSLWFFIPLAVFIVSKSNLPLYVLPLFLPLAAMTAREMEKNNFPISTYRTKIIFWCILLILARPVMGGLKFSRDASAFAGEIRSRYAGPVGECVFVNVRPALGLQFYTGADVKRVALEPADMGGLYRGQGTRLWFVPPEDAERFREMAGRLNIPVRDLGLIHERDEYALYREMKPSKLPASTSLPTAGREAGYLTRQ